MEPSLRHLLAVAISAALVSSQRDGRCNMPIVIGTGLYRIPRWGFNVNTGICELFYYSGCCGNENNFETVQECEGLCGGSDNPCLIADEQTTSLRLCGNRDGECGSSDYCHFGATAENTVCCPMVGGDVCELGGPLTGEGGDALPRFYFDPLSSRCQQFVYRGTKGDQNNFLSRESCERACGRNPCAVGQAAPGRCSPTVAGGGSSNSCPAEHWCHPGAGQETTVCCPGAVNDPCNLPVSVGKGESQLSRYSFDGRVCIPFIYRGLGGNQNNFINLQDCRRTCLKTYSNPCVGQPAKYPSGAPIFCSLGNRETCPVNFWCHLGATPETTLCCPGATIPCAVPLAPGRGRAALPRWYYNSDSRQCSQFSYFGLGGNQNSFVTQAECQENCPEG